MRIRGRVLLTFLPQMLFGEAKRSVAPDYISAVVSHSRLVKSIDRRWPHAMRPLCLAVAGMRRHATVQATFCWSSVSRPFWARCSRLIDSSRSI